MKFTNCYRRVISTGLVLGLLAGIPLSARGALVGYWKFDETSGTTAADSSGNGLNGTLSGAGTGAAPTWTAGRFGNALDFNTPSAPAASNANGSLVTVPFNAAFRLNDAFTVSFWYQPDQGFNNSTYPGPMRIGSQNATTGTNIGWGFFRNGSSEAVTFKRGNAQPAGGSTTALNPNQWYHIALTHDGTNNNTLYVNGVPTNFTQAWLDATTSTALEFGRMDSFDDADLDDIALYDQQLTLGQARSLYTVPTNLALANYDLTNVSSLWSIHNAGPGSSGVVDGTTWYYTDTLPGTPSAGDAYLSGSDMYVALSATTGLTTVPIPEPSFYAIAALGLFVLGVSQSWLGCRK